MGKVINVKRIICLPQYLTKYGNENQGQYNVGIGKAQGQNNDQVDEGQEDRFQYPNQYGYYTRLITKCEKVTITNLTI